MTRNQTLGMVASVVLAAACTDAGTTPVSPLPRSLEQPASVSSLPLSLTVLDPVGDETGSIDVVRMELSFDNTSGEYLIVLTADAAHPFLGQFSVNINLFDPDVGTTDPTPSFFTDVHSDFDLGSPLTTLTFTGTDPNLLAWTSGQRVFTNSLAGTGNPDGVTLFRTSVSGVPFTFLTNEDVVAFAALDQPAVIQPNQAPVVSVAGPSTATEGAVVTFDATGSADPDGDPLSYTWDFGDGGEGSGPTPTHAYADNGTYTVTVVATDPSRQMATATTTVTIVNVAPAIDQLPSTTLIVGESYSATGAFTDPGADAWSATVDYGDGSGALTLQLQGKEFGLSHQYAAAGSYTITVTVADDDGGIGVAVINLTIETPREAIQELAERAEYLFRNGGLGGEGPIGRTNVLRGVEFQLVNGNTTAALSKLNAFVNMVEALRRSGRLAPEVAAELIEMAQRIARALSQPVSGPT